MFMMRASQALRTSVSRSVLPVPSHALLKPRRLMASLPGAAATTTLCTLETLPWDHSFVRELPGDTDTKNVVRQVFDALYTPVQPTPAAGEPKTITFSSEVASLIGLDPSECNRPEFALLFAGAAPLPGAKPYAQCYGGHQFGSWAGQLGDGRAITLGEVLAEGEQGSGNKQRWELQLKGAGKTPYSRMADGRAVLRSSVREYVASEAMAGLGVPTTRALSLVATGDVVMRDMFYNGNRKMEPGAIVCRVSPSFVRFGTFQLPAARGNGQEILTIKVADYVIRHHYPHLLTSEQLSQGAGTEPGRYGSDVYTAFFKEVCERTGRLVAMWQCVGFVHGVLNSDNCSILGVTIDYGPYGFLDRFDPFYTPNLTDFEGRRYAYSQQPEAVQFNLMMLANALLGAGLIDRDMAQTAFNGFGEALNKEYEGRVAKKLGTKSYDKHLTTELFKLMYQDDADFTNTFRALSDLSSSEDCGCIPAGLRACIGTQEWTAEREEAWKQWLSLYTAQLRADGMSDADRVAMMKSVNPKFIPRQHLLQMAIEGAEVGDYSELETLLELCTRPYDDHPGADPKYTTPPTQDQIKPGVTCLSCSS